ncbi:MAG: hypothetical protein WBM45_05855, partial [Woeseiaceae bacterium]
MTTSVDVVNLLVRGAGAVNPSGLERRICSAICSNGDNPKAVAWHGIIAHECVRNHCASNSSKLRREARDALLKAESMGPGPLGSL